MTAIETEHRFYVAMMDDDGHFKGFLSHPDKGILKTMIHRSCYHKCGYIFKGRDGKRK